MTQQPSLFERIGGAAAVEAAVPLFYSKVLVDPRINGFFEGLDMNRQKQHMKAFLTMALGGMNKYNGRNMRASHAGLVERGLNDSHFNAVGENLVNTLKELAVPQPAIDEIVAIVETTRVDVLGR